MKKINKESPCSELEKYIKQQKEMCSHQNYQNKSTCSKLWSFDERKQSPDKKKNIDILP